MRVDNGVRFFAPTGTLVNSWPYNELYKVMWRPASPSSFPEFTTPAPVEQSKTAETKAAEAASNKYIPPHLRNPQLAEKVRSASSSSSSSVNGILGDAPKKRRSKPKYNPKSTPQ
jgi:uncharacterized protein with WD repeat